MTEFPQDIIVEILSRLPVKSLLRFKCISKPWLSLITSPNFIKKHLNQTIQDRNFNIMVSTKKALYPVESIQSFHEDEDEDDEEEDEDEEIDYPLKSLDYKHGVRIIGSCDGLLCIQGIFGYTICLWNPCTKEFKKIPSTTVKTMRLFVFSSGFGYDPTINDYKLVRIDYTVGGGQLDSQVKVYTLGTNTWRTIEHVPLSPPYYEFPGVHVNGSVHWVTKTKASVGPNSVVAFNLVDEEFKEVPQPDCVKDKHIMNVAVGVFRGCLCMLYHFGLQVDVWVMNDYGVKDSWTKIFTITHQLVIGPFKYLRPLCFSKTGEVLLAQGNDDMVMYDPKRAKAWALGVSLFQIETYVGSLVSLNSGTYVGAKSSGKDTKGEWKDEALDDSSLEDDWSDSSFDDDCFSEEENFRGIESPSVV